MSKLIGKYWRLLFASLIAAALLNSCNSYKGISKHEPKSTKDTARLSKRFLTTFPVKPAEIKQGEEVKQPDSTEYFKQLLAVQLAKKPLIKDSIKIKFIESNKDVDSIYDEGYSNGYQVGKIDGKTTCPPSTKRVDSVFQDRPQTTADLWLANDNLANANDEIAQAEKLLLQAKNTIEQHVKNESSLWWTIKNFFSFRWIWLLCFLISIYLLRKPLSTIVRKLINPLA